MRLHRLGLTALALLGLILLLTIARYSAPPARAGGGSSFAAASALPILQTLVGDGVPHPTGSPANAVVRDRIVSMLHGYGYRPQIQRAFVCGANGACATVENILARLEGTAVGGRGTGEGGAEAVLVAVHYDSVGAGAGASDDGMAVAAVLEVARILRAEPLPRDVIFLIDDGEEQGLLGARAFAEQHPWSKDVGAVINIEARGTSGPSVMFETNAGNSEVISLVAASLPRPVTNSINYTIYKLLPNDTDFTVFKQYGWQGVNFGIVGDPARYHTPLDHYGYAHPRSLQHHGENILAMTRAFATRDARAASTEDAVFFDVLTLFVVHWPERWTRIIALSAAALFLLGVVIAGGVRLSDVLWGAGSVLVVLLGSGGSGYLLQKLAHTLGAFPADWTAARGWWLLAFWNLAVAAALVAAWLLRHRETAGVWTGIWSVWIAGAAAAAFMLPGISYPLLVPAAAAAVVSVAVRSERWRPVVVLLPLLTAALLIFPIAWLLYSAMGNEMLPGISLLAGVVLTGLVAAAGSFPKPALFAAPAIAALGILAGFASPALTPHHPAPASLIVYQHELEARRLLADIDGPLPDTLREAGFHMARVRPFSWDGRYSAYAAAIDIPPAEPPDLQVLQRLVSGEAIRYRARLRSNRGAPVAGVFLPRERTSDVSVNGSPVPLRAGRSPYVFIRMVTPAPEGMEIEWTLQGTEAATAYAADVSYGLPDAAVDAARARGDRYVAYGAGDRVMVSREVRID